jgi:hypothetical protein
LKGDYGKEKGAAGLSGPLIGGHCSQELVGNAHPTQKNVKK